MKKAGGQNRAFQPRFDDLEKLIGVSSLAINNLGGSVPTETTTTELTRTLSNNELLQTSDVVNGNNWESHDSEVHDPEVTSQPPTSKTTNGPQPSKGIRSLSLRSINISSGSTQAGPQKSNDPRIALPSMQMSNQTSQVIARNAPMAIDNRMSSGDNLPLIATHTSSYTSDLAALNKITLIGNAIREKASATDKISFMDSGVADATGTGSNSASNTASQTSSLSSEGPQSGGAYTITGTNASGGGTAQGRLSINGSRPDIVGGAQQFNIVLPSNATPSNINWTYSGATPLYGPQPVPNPSQGDTGFAHNSFAMANQHGASVGFNYGETPGGGTITVSATVTVGRGHKDNVTASLPITVREPFVKITVTTLKSGTTVQDQDLAYGTGSSNPGMKYVAETNFAGGQIGIVQTLTSSTATNSDGTRTVTGPVKKNSDNTYSSPSFPILDTSTNPSKPWFKLVEPTAPNTSDDSPRAPMLVLPSATTATLKDKFKTYVMFKPGSGIFVPILGFDWGCDLKATYAFTMNVFGSSWTVTNVTPPINSPYTTTQWPTWSTGGVANDYNTLS